MSRKCEFMYGKSSVELYDSSTITANISEVGFTVESMLAASEEMTVRQQIWDTEQFKSQPITLHALPGTYAHTKDTTDISLPLFIYMYEYSHK